MLNLSVILPFARHSGFLFRLLTRSLLVVAVCFSVLLLALRYWLLPNIEYYREDIASIITQAAGQQVTIGAISANWDGLRPHLMLRTVQVHDKEGNPALLLNQIESTLSWLSLLHGEIRFHEIKIAQPDLTVRRDAAGIIHLAGIALNPDQSESGFPDWLLRQRQLVISNAAVLWQDEQRSAPPLELKAVNLHLENRGHHHRFGVHATPPSELAAPLDVRGDFTGESLSTLEKWRGQLFTQLDYADIAAWRAWLSFPEAIEFNQGAGALRMWIGINGAAVEQLTADVHLQNVKTRLAQELPEMDLIRLQGRVGWAKINDGANEGIELSTRRLSVSVRDEQVLQPMDFSLQTFPGSDSKAGSGELNVSMLDLETLMNLAEYLPIRKPLDERLAELSPRGEIRDMRVKWSGEWPAPAHLSVKGRFVNLGMNKFDKIPAFNGISGSIDGTEQGGTLNINSQNAGMELLDIFREPLLLDTFIGQISWNSLTDNDSTELKFSDIAFANSHAAGTIYGSYHTVRNAPGVIDLTGHLTRADARHMGFYLPVMAANQPTRDWLDKALVAGESNDVRLRLKGDLAKFPFNHDADGIFQINLKASGIVLDYVPGWPRIENMAADLLIHGSRMEINASQANIFNARLSKVKAQIADMAAPAVILKIEGEADGATKEFLKFVEKSPLSGYTYGMADGISAIGSGELLLKLDIPLQRPDDIKLTGSYQFISNQINPGPYLPNLEQVNGVLAFTESGIKVENITAQTLGGPVVINSTAPPGGGLRVAALGKANLDNLRQLARSRPGSAMQIWTRYLHGSTDWHALIHIHNKLTNVSIESSLQGITSTLPEPFTKTAVDATPLSFERRATGLQRDNLNFSYGRLVTAQIMRSRDNAGSYHAERGMVSFGTTPTLSPGRAGVSITGSLPLLNMDQWRSLSKQLHAEVGPSLNLARINLHIGALDFLDRRFNDTTLNASIYDGEWHSTVASREINGNIIWHPSGNGKIVARLKNLVMPAASPTKADAATQVQQQGKDLPALDVVADDFVISEKQLGRLELVANQQKQDWHIEKLHITNSDSSLITKGIWQNHAPSPRIQTEIKLEVSNIGKFLTRLGYPDHVKRGKGKLEGVLSWYGNPQSIDYPTLSGSLRLRAKRGQFPKLETGIGKLFSIFDLQALPRRITLDFHDVLSEGFAFDDVSGNVRITRGVAITDDLKIEGSAAKLTMSGEVNLAAETQKLHVKVFPSLGLVTPVASIASMIANKELKDPFDQVASSEYDITGTWADPIVTKIHRQAQGPKEHAQ